MIAAIPSPALGDEEPAALLSYENDIRPLLETYCFKCHGDGEDKGGLALDDFKDEASVAEDRATWLDIFDMVDFYDMPPKDELQPTEAERERLIGWIDGTLNRLDCDGPADPGRVTLRRLNRNEYRNTIRDLVGVAFDPSGDFPADDVGYGFDNIGDVLSVSTLLMERYLAAAQQITDEAIVTAPITDQPTVRRVMANNLDVSGDADRSSGGRRLRSNGEFFFDHDFERPGEYQVRVRAWGDQAGDEPVRMAVRLNDKELKVIDVKGHHRDNRKSPETQTFIIEAEIPRGEHRVEAAFINDFYESEEENRNLIVAYMEVEGPLGRPEDSLPESHRRIMIAHPEEEGKSEEEAAREVLSAFATRAYRRPVTDDELNRLLEIVELVRDEGENFERQIQVALQAVLVSPHFLFRVEKDREPDDPDHPRAGYTLSDYELATRLSYFIWSSMPDEELFALAESGKLREGDNLDEQIRRMIADPRAVTGLVENFGGQWLQTRNLQTVSPDPDVFPEFDDAMRAAMARETLLFFEEVMRKDRSVLDFLDADFTYVNEQLAEHYGIEGIEGEDFRRISLKNPARGGVITQASVLTITSDPTRTSPVKRGKWVLEEILGTPPPPPPPDVPELEEEEDGQPLTGTLRERMEQHREDPNCSVCHIRMDAIGFAFENFDGIGGWREKDGEYTIDPSGELPGGQSFNGPAELKKILLEDHDRFVENLARKMLTYGIGRGLEYYDDCAVEEITAKVAENDYRFSGLVTAIVHSDPFQKRRGKVDTDE